MLTIIIGMKKGDTRSGPFSSSTRCVSRSVVIPPIPEPMRTPNRVPSTLSVSSAASWTAMAAHAIAYWRKGSRRRASFLSTKSSGSKFFTSPAMRVG